MSKGTLHRLVKRGDYTGVQGFLQARPLTDVAAANAIDRSGLTPLMYAVKDRSLDVGLVRLLLEHGASTSVASGQIGEGDSGVLPLALAAGDPDKVTALIEAGADIKYQRPGGYDALINAVHGRDILRDARLIELLELLVRNGVSLSGTTTYRESGLRVLSRIGRFDAVDFLLGAGADERHLQWTPLIRAVALGSLSEVESAVRGGASLEGVDWWERTAWLVAIQVGDIAKARFLRDSGANTTVRGRCGMPPLFYAIENHHPRMLKWLLDIGCDREHTDEFATSPLVTATGCDDIDCVNILLEVGADADRVNDGHSALDRVRSRTVALRLLDAGADPSRLSDEGRRLLVGLPPEPDEDLLDVSPEEFHRGRGRRFGSSNPEHIREPFWECMIRAGMTGYTANELFDGPSSFDAGPVWCARRFGQSLTFLPDGRVVQIAGEHEDHYDPDFCIYNDVFVHERDGTVRIFGYPEATFPATDFHTATLIGEHIYVIGSLGYAGKRQIGETPVYRLDTRSFQIERVTARGESPGWLYGHRAVQRGPHEIGIAGGKVVTTVTGEEVHIDNEESFVLDTAQLTWRAV